MEYFDTISSTEYNNDENYSSLDWSLLLTFLKTKQNNLAALVSSLQVNKGTYGESCSN